MANILETITGLLKTSIEGDPPPPQILLDINNQVDELMAVSVDLGGDGINRWLSKLHEISNNTRLHETLLVRAFKCILGPPVVPDMPLVFATRYDLMNTANSLHNPSGFAAFAQHIFNRADTRFGDACRNL